jgi:hypothetical protein
VSQSLTCMNGDSTFPFSNRKPVSPLGFAAQQAQAPCLHAATTIRATGALYNSKFKDNTVKAYAKAPGPTFSAHTLRQSSSR